MLLESLIALIRAETYIVALLRGCKKKMMNGRTSMGWAGASLVIAGGLIGLYGFSIMDLTSIRILNWWALDFALVRIGIVAALAGVATLLASSFATAEKVSVVAKVPLMVKLPLTQELPHEDIKKEIEIPA